MFLQVLLCGFSSVGAAGLGWYLCRQAMRAEMLELEARLKDRLRDSVDRRKAIQAKIERARLEARLDEARQLLLALTAQPQPAPREPSWSGRMTECLPAAVTLPAVVDHPRPRRAKAARQSA